MAERPRKKKASTMPQPPWAEHFRHTLRACRERLGLSQRQLAERAGLTQEAIAILEAGKSVPRLDNALALARGLETTLDVLMGTAPPAPHVVHYHTPGEVRVWVSNGVVILGNYGPAEIEKLVDTWNHLRGQSQHRDDKSFPTVEQALGNDLP